MTGRWGSPVLALATALAAPAMAQAPEIRAGLLGGVNLATAVGEGTEDIVNKSNRVGILGGAFLEVGLNRHLAMSPEAYYTMKGVKGSDAGFDAEVKVNWIEIPVLLKLLIPTQAGDGRVRPHFYAGPAVSIRTGCSVELSQSGTSLEFDCDDPDVEAELKSTDFNLVFGGGIDIGRIFVGARYDIGLADLNDSPQATSADAVRSRAFSILGGVSFSLGR